MAGPGIVVARKNPNSDGFMSLTVSSVGRALSTYTRVASIGVAIVVVSGCGAKPEQFVDDLHAAIESKSRLRIEALVDVEAISQQVAAARAEVLIGLLGEFGAQPADLGSLNPTVIERRALDGLAAGSFLDALRSAVFLDELPDTSLQVGDWAVVDRVGDRAVIEANVTSGVSRTLRVRGILARSAEDTWRLTELDNPTAIFEWLVRPRRDRLAALTQITRFLRNLASAEEMHFAAHGTYIVDLVVLREELDWLRQDSINVSITQADRVGWAAVGTHVRLGTAIGCALVYGWPRASIPIAYTPGGIKAVEPGKLVCDPV